jgi:hypothetical protein
MAGCALCNRSRPIWSAPVRMNAIEKSKLVPSHPSDGNMNLDLAWDVLKELGKSERHFNNLEAEYRKLASIWLLAAFAGMGFILKQNPEMAVPREVALVAIGLAASIGIFLLWIVDLLVYHQLLDACFTQAKEIEKTHKELPPVRSSMENTQGGGKVVTTRLRWFYILLTAAPVVFSAPLFVLWCQKQYGLTAALIAGATSAAYISITSGIIWTNVPGLKKSSGPDALSAAARGRP